MFIKNLIADINPGFSSIDKDQSVRDALSTMAKDGSSAVLVMDKTIPQGIFTERDLVRCHTEFEGQGLEEIKVDAVMTSSLIVSEPEDRIDEAMAMMTKARIRHLPVIEGGTVTCVVSLEDLVRRHVGELTRELHYLKDYISTLQDAVHD